MNYSGIDLIKYVQDLHEKYYKTHEIKELNKWREFLSPWIERLNTVKMLVLPNFIYTFSAFKIPPKLFRGYQQSYSKVYRRGKRPHSQHDIEEKQSIDTQHQDLRQTYSKQDRVVLAKEQIDQSN